jgi:protein SCO1
MRIRNEVCRILCCCNRAAALASLVCLLLANRAPAQLSMDPAQSAGTSPAIYKKVRFEQRLGRQIPLDLNFTDEHGHSVTLRQYFGHGPVILTLAYYRCPMLCTEELNGLVRGLRPLKFELGRDYQVVTVSFDPGDTTALAGSKHEEYAVMYGRRGGENGWHFLTGNPAQIDQLAQSVGFHYAYDPESKQFAHASGIMILTEQGILSQYTYGVSFPERDLRLGLIRASQNQIGNVVDQVLLYCYHYDPQTGKYGVVISRALTIGGALTVLVLGLGMLTMFRKEHYELDRWRLRCEHRRTSSGEPT